jgi:hypothetical protein
VLPVAFAALVYVLPERLLTARLMKRVVDTPGVFGSFFTGGPAIELESVHHLEKLVDGAPLRRPWWFFDVRVQGTGAVDIPTHLVDQTRRVPESEPAFRALRRAPALRSRSRRVARCAISPLYVRVRAP